ncbi:MAG: bifunctional diguanylate cyclase/phosphodiesterase [Proteocatella sp.]
MRKTKRWHIVVSIVSLVIFGLIAMLYIQELEKIDGIIAMTRQLMLMITFLFSFTLPCVLYSININNKKLEKVAYYDELCNIKNQNGFVKHASEMLKNKKANMAFAYIDIDNFKAINNIFSYQYGNEVLIQLAKILEEIFGEKAIVGRFSGDNFAVLAEYEEEADFTGKINVIQEIANKRCHNEKELMLAIGIHFVKNNEEQFNQIFDKGNIAKHSVKHLDKSRYSIYDEEVGRLMQEEDTLIEEIKKAIKQMDFDVYYQPKFDFATKRIMASEALIRWEHKEHGFISPVKFIPVAEKTHLIVGIGHFVFERVCSDIQNWISMGIKPFPVSVNFSRIEILQGDMIEFIEKTVKKYDVSYELLEIEITETIAVSDYEKIEMTLNEIKRLGMTISIDDFGAGYSSLGCLQKFNVDTLKIDRSFIMDLENNKRGNNILKGMIDLSKKLELKTICEGIETQEQMKMLEMLDCDYGQGFIFARPMKESEFRKKLLE